MRSPSELSTQSGASRGDRLYPPRNHRCHWILTSLRQEYEQIIDAHVQNSLHMELVDYGCGNMPYRPLFEPLVYKYHGCDLPGNEMADHVLESPYSLPFRNHSVDIVLSAQVLEHVAEPSKYLAEARRILKPTGMLLLSTHGVWKYHPDPYDYWRWTGEGLAELLRRSGFEIRHFSGVLGPESTALQLYQDAVLPKMSRWRRSLFAWFMQRRIQKADERCSAADRMQDASVYVLVGIPHPVNL